MLNKIYYYVKSEEFYLSDGGMTDERKNLLCYRTQGLPQNEINKIKAALEHEIDAAVTDGFTCFMSGFADGVDQYFAELVLERKQTTPALELIAVIPYRKRLDSLNKKTRTRELLEACADVVVIQEKYLPSVYSHRNRYMVEHSDRVIAVYDGRETGGTAKTIRFTHRMKKELREIPVGEIVLPDHLKPKTK